MHLGELQDKPTHGLYPECEDVPHVGQPPTLYDKPTHRLYPQCEDVPHVGQPPTLFDRPTHGLYAQCEDVPHGEVGVSLQHLLARGCTK